jgi:hypothetical protein
MTSRGVRRLILFLTIALASILLERAWLDSIRPRVPFQVSADQMAAKSAEAQQRQLFETYKTFGNTLTVVIILGTAWILIPRPRPRDRSIGHFG